MLASEPVGGSFKVSKFILSMTTRYFFIYFGMVLPLDGIDDASPGWCFPWMVLMMLPLDGASPGWY